MATPAPNITSQEKYEALGDFYLSLWKQIDLLSGEGKWIELRPIDPSKLKAHVDERFDDIRGSVQDSEMLKIVERDYSRTEELVSKYATGPNPVPEAEQKDLEAFKTYLRDQGLRYDEAADHEGAFAAAHTGD